MGTITTNSVDYRSGTGTINFIHPSLSDTTMKVESISSLDFEFDIEDLKDKADTIFFGPADISVMAFDRLGNGNSLFSEIDGVTATDEIELELDWTTNGGRSFTMSLYFTPTDVDYKRAQRKLNIEASYQYYGRASQTFAQIINNSTLQESFLNDVSNTIDCLAPEDFIQEVFDDIESANTNIIESNSFKDEKNESDTWILGNQGGGPYEQITDATVVLYRLAAMDGSIVGSGMGYNFFINRLDTTNNVSISQSDAELLDIDLTNKNYNTIITHFAHKLTNQNNVWASWSSSYGSELNPKSPKSMVAFFFMTEMDAAVWVPANNRYEDNGYSVGTADYFSDSNEVTADAKEGSYQIYVDGSSWSEGDHLSFHNFDGQFTPSGKNIYVFKSGDSTKAQFHNSLTSNEDESVTDDLNFLARWDNTNNYNSTYMDNTRECYEKAYGADGSRSITIRVFGIDTIKPYQTFTADSSFPSSVQGKTFRPSTISYDLERDTAQIEAYQIA